MIVEFRGIRSCGAPEAAHRNLRIPSAFAEINPSRRNAAVVFERGVCCSHTAVARKSHGSRGAEPPVSQFRQRHRGCRPAATQVVLASTTASTSPSSAACPSAG